MNTENLQTLKIHRLTQSQYDRELEAGNIDENALYLTPDEEVDLSGYATVEQLEEKADTVHTHNDIYYTETEIDEKIATINETISNLDSATAIDNKICTHNESDSAHSDIRGLIDELSTKLNAFLDVDDTTTDQLSEVLTLIEQNKDALESLADGVNVLDIADNLITEDSSKALSAKQGVVIKTLIDELQTVVDGKANAVHTHTSDEVTDLQSKLDDINLEIDGCITDLSVSGQTITYTKNNGSTGTITTQDENTDTNVTNTLATTTKAYITGTTSNVTNTGTQVFDTGVYLDNVAGQLVATTFKGDLNGNANSATQAVCDSSQRIITDTYETKTDASAKLEEAKAYADNVKNDLLNGAGTAYDTLKELGDLIDDNTDAIEALETIASGKADASHTHAIADVSGLQTALNGKAASSHGTHVSYSTTAPVMDGTASVGTASTVARSDHKHPTDTSRASQTALDSHTSNTTAHITSTERTNWGTAYTHSQAAHAPSNAQPNQNAFSNVKVGSTTVAADTTTDTLTLVAGTNVQITADANADSVTISATDTVYTHPNSGVATGTYKSVTVNAQGHVTAGSNPTTLSGYGITDAVTSSEFDSSVLNLQNSIDGCMRATNPDGSGYFSMNRKWGSIIGDYSVALGYNGTASGDYSVALGGGDSSSSAASGNYSVVIGAGNTASGECSYAEGFGTTASGAISHAEGWSTTAGGQASHSEGAGATATNDYAHAEGYYANASGLASHAEGNRTTALDYQHAQGHYNNTTNAKAGVNSGTSTGTAFVIGNGTSSAASNAFRVTYDGKPYAKSTLGTTGADYAEFFEWQDLNPDNEDRRGYFVTLDGDKIRIAEPNDYILGIISGQPSVVGNGDEDWLGRYIFDEFGAFVYEDFEYEVDEFDKETGEKITVIKTGKKYKENPEYDPTIPYIQREDRPEWDYVGMLGVLSVRDDGTCKVNGYCTVAEGGIATASETGYRVIKRVNDNIVKVIFR